jgi:hypothetical protein
MVELGTISRMFNKLSYDDPIEVKVDNSKLGDVADPHGLELDRVRARIKIADADNHKYELSKLKLVGTITSMCTKDVADKLISHSAAIKKYLTETNDKEEAELLSLETVSISSKKSSGRVVEKSKSRDVNIGDISTCPLTLWRSLVFILTSKTSGNRRVDQDNAATAFSNMHQRAGESTIDYLARFRISVESYEMLSLDPPSQEIQAMRFIQGLDNIRYGAMQTYYGNELLIGRDLYPTDLATSAERASTWLVRDPLMLHSKPRSPSPIRNPLGRRITRMIRLRRQHAMTLRNASSAASPDIPCWTASSLKQHKSSH